MNDDLISRQDAIEYCTNGLYRLIVISFFRKFKIYSDIADKIEIWLNDLPSAQPTMCEYWDNESSFCALHRPSAQPEQGCDECIFKPFKQFQPEREKGKWIIDKDCEGKSRTVTCNRCGHKEFNWHNPNFCENCGADMRGEEDAKRIIS